MTGHGMRVSVEELRRYRREARRLAMAPADAVASLFPGLYRARFSGRGIEFDEVRGYQAGDDYRAVDWRVTARTGQVHTKLFHEERERSLYLVIDAGPSMHFGTRQCLKWVLAARIAALFAWLAVDGGNRVGGLVFGIGDRVLVQRLAAGETGAMKLFHLLAGMPQGGKAQASTLADALGQLRHLAAPGSLILLLSDFADPGEAFSRELAHLRRHNEVAAIHISDPLEQRLPSSGIYPVSDGQREMLLDCGDAVLRRAYAERFEARYAALQQLLQRHGIRLLAIDTGGDLVEMLRQRLPPVRQRSRMAG